MHREKQLAVLDTEGPQAPSAVLGPQIPLRDPALPWKSLCPIVLMWHVRGYSSAPIKHLFLQGGLCTVLCTRDALTELEMMSRGAKERLVLPLDRLCLSTLGQL